MTYAYHWPKAMAISVFLHIIILVTAGYLTAGLTTELSPPQEVLLEMDLASDPADRLGTSPELVQDIPSVPSPVIPTETPVTETQAEPVITTSELTMTEADVPAFSSTVSQSSSSNASAPASAGSAAPAAGGGSRSGVAKPGILSKVDPVYPEAARKAGLEGTALLRIQISASGRPSDIEIARSTGHATLDQAAVTAVTKWRFVPAKDRNSGRTIACTTTLPISFRLH
jgi:protein TonB